jgi:hypothetical protein
VRILAEMRIRKSSSKQIFLIPEMLINPEEGNCLGLIAQQTILDELKICLDDEIPDERTDMKVCCLTRYHFEMPCCHLLRQRILEERIPLLTLDDIPYYMRKQNWNGPEAEHLVNDIPPKESSRTWAYSEIKNFLDPFMAMAKRSGDVRKVLETAFSSLRALKSTKEKIQEIHLPGSLKRKPSLDSPISKCGGRKRNRSYHCSHCGATSHNRARCPFKEKSPLPVISVAEENGLSEIVESVED